jgi:heptosyltransferase-1
MVAIVGAPAALQPNPRILLVKTSSLGDVVHNLPVASDLRRHFPNAQIDWLVEEGFAAIPRLHPAVRQVLPLALRRWKKHLLKRNTWQQVGALKKALAAAEYDIVLDTQGLLKSAICARWAQGARHGYAADSIREPLAARAYEYTHQVSKKLHAVERNRRLAAAAFGYTLDSPCDYGIQASPLNAPWLPNDRAYVVLLTATSRDDKLWVEDNWIELGRALAARSMRAILPGGSPIERERAARIAAAIDGIAAPALDIPALAQLIAGASGVIGVDTGLTHLGAALGRPTLAIFCATDPGLTGVYAAQAVHNLGGIAAPPTAQTVLQHCADWI